MRALTMRPLVLSMLRPPPFTLRRCFSAVAAAASSAPSSSHPPPPSASAGALSKLLAAAREYGPAAAGVWTVLYVLPGAAVYGWLAAHGNYGLDLADAAAAAESLPESLRGAAREALAAAAAAGTALGAPAAALQPWHTSAALAWLATEAVEPVRFIATIGIVRSWKRQQAAAADAATGGAAEAPLR